MEDEQNNACDCFQEPCAHLELNGQLGMDDRYADVSLLVCRQCGQIWLQYHYELEAFTASGRWYLGAITDQQAEHMTAQEAKATLEALSWYFYGGSYFAGQTGRVSGPLA